MTQHDPRIPKSLFSIDGGTWIRLLTRAAVLPLIASSVLLGGIAPVQAAGPANVLGTWTVDSASASPCCSTIFATENFSTGAVNGTADGGVFVVAGTVTGNSIMFTTSESGYTAHDKAVISANDAKMTGSFDDTNGNKGTFILDHELVEISGHLWTTDCTDTTCSRAGDGGDQVKVESAAAAFSKTATTAKDGSWSVKAPTGTYTVTPPKGFVPQSKTVNATAAVSGVDFAICGALSLSSSTSRRSAASGQTGCPDGIDWKMENRTIQVPIDAGKTGLGIIGQKDIYAPYTVTLSLTVQHSPVTRCSTHTTWKWEVTSKPSGSKILNTPKPGCSTFMQVSEQGTYKVDAKRFAGTKLRQTVHGKIEVHDLLVVAMGDSNGSGEGDPPFWFDQCNRGEASYQYQAASLLEKQSHLHSSVTFVSASCSGARIQHLINTPYEGVNPGAPLPPQIKQIQDGLKPPAGQKQRPVDAAVISAGVNDLSFGPILEYCVLYVFHTTPCQDSPVRAVTGAHGIITEFVKDSKSKMTLGNRIDALVHKLPAKYGRLGAALTASHLVKPSDVYLTQYPAFFYGKNGKFCSFFGSGLSTIPTSTWQWLAGEADDLNAEVARASRANGWNVVPVPASLFYDHGYCSSDSWFVSISRGIILNGNKAGLFHPTPRGAHVTAVLTLEEMCDLLNEPADCSKFPTP